MFKILCDSSSDTIVPYATIEPDRLIWENNTNISVHKLYCIPVSEPGIFFSKRKSSVYYKCCTITLLNSTSDRSFRPLRATLQPRFHFHPCIYFLLPGPVTVQHVNLHAIWSIRSLPRSVASRVNSLLVSIPRDLAKPALLHFSMTISPLRKSNLPHLVCAPIVRSLFQKKLKVLLVSDDASDSAAATNAVEVGHFSSQNDHRIVAHFC